MNLYRKPLLALVMGGLLLAGGAGLASAREDYGHGHRSGHPGYRQQMPDLSPEMRTALDKAYAESAPLQLELRAKRAELMAKIYSGADEATIQGLTQEVNRLHNRLTELHVSTEKQLAKAGMPMGYDCALGFKGMHRGPGGHRGGPGYGPCYGRGQDMSPPVRQ